LLAKYNALLKEHDESLVLSKQVSNQYDKLKFDHVDLRQKYNYLELAYEALEDNLEQASKIESLRKVLLTPLLRMHLVSLRARKSGLI
jgi:hypothetical protein